MNEFIYSSDEIFEDMIFESPNIRQLETVFGDSFAYARLGFTIDLSEPQYMVLASTASSMTSSV